ECEERSPSAQSIQHIALRELDFAEGLNAERASGCFFRDARIIGEIHLCVKTTRQHSVVSVDQVVCNANIIEPQAWQFSHKTIILGIQSGLDEINELYSTLLFGASFEQFFLACPDRSARQLPLYDGKALLDFSFVNACTVPPKKKFSYIRGYRILSFELTNKVLANEVSLKSFRSDLIQ